MKEFVDYKIKYTKLGGDEKRLGYLQYVSVISAYLPCTYYVHRHI